MHILTSVWRGLLAASLAAVALWAGDEAERRAPGLEFAGYHATEKAAWIILAERKTGEVSSWLRVGQEWKGFRVARIDEKGETVVLTKEASSWVVPLRKGRVVEGRTVAQRGPSGFILLRGDVSWSEGTWVYTADAVVQFGEAVLSAISGVMVFEGDTIRGHLALDAVDGRSIEVDEATARLIEGQPVLVAGKLGIKFSKK